jgi:serine/threonine-protein kinase
VSSTPPGASVEIDGARAGTTPLEAAVSPGSHTVALSLDGYASERSAVTLGGPGETGVLVFTLRPVARPSRPGASPAVRSGTLTISTSPWSRVYLGARLLGTTPLANAALPAGRHTLTLRAPGRADKRIVVTIGADAETRVREVL